jgi:hypothetical protein
MMTKSIKGFRRLLLVVVMGLLLAGTLPLWAGDTLANGLKPVVGKTFRLALLGSKEAERSDLRSYQKLIQSLYKVEKKFLKWGVSLDRSVRIMLFSDTDFPCRDFWKAAGYTPDASTISAFEEDNSLLYATLSGYEMAHQTDLLRDKWFFLNSVLLPKKYAAQPKQLTGEDLTMLVKLIKERCARLAANLDQPASANNNDYNYFADAAYSFPIGTLWVPITKPGSLHRDLSTIVHEFGHHAFYQLVNSIVNKHKTQKNWTRLQLFATNKSLLALNELFADFASIANGFEVAIPIHNYGKLPHDFKRYFSQDRTLANFMEDIKNSPPKIRELLTEEHNSLNPCRTFVWKLNLALGDDANEKLVVTAVRNAIAHFYGKVVPNSKRTPSKIGWGCFTIDGYPIDVRTENLRFLEFLQEAANQVLNAEQKQIFAREAAKVFPGEYPLKQSFR